MKEVVNNFIDLGDKIIDLEEKNKELQERIDKAIEILEKYNDNESNYYVPVDMVLEILKGSDKE